MEVLANAMVKIILQFINVSNQYIVHLKLTQCYVSIIIKLYDRVPYPIMKQETAVPKKA